MLWAQHWLHSLLWCEGTTMDTQGSVWCQDHWGHKPRGFMGSTVDIHKAEIGACVWSGLHIANIEKQEPQGCNLSCPYLSERIKQGLMLSNFSCWLRTPLSFKQNLAWSCLTCRHAFWAVRGSRTQRNCQYVFCIYKHLPKAPDT